MEDLTAAEVIEARQMARDKFSIKVIADLYGVPVHVLRPAVTGETWAELNQLQAPVRPEPPKRPERQLSGPKSALSDDAVRAIRASKESLAVLAARYEISRNHVSNIQRGRALKHVA